MAIKDYSTTPDLNTQISGINIAEGCAPSGINNAIRQLMADMKVESEAIAGALTDPVATGSTTPRALSDRFADIVNVLDFGAKADAGVVETVVETIVPKPLVVIVAGQSNAAGSAGDTATQDIEVANSAYWNRSYWVKPLRDPVTPAPDGGWVPAFAQYVSNMRSRPVYVINVAVGGANCASGYHSDSGSWGSTGGLRARSEIIVSAALAAMSHEYDMLGTIWIQGESDVQNIVAGREDISDYTASVTEVVEWAMQTFGGDFFISKLSYLKDSAYDTQTDAINAVLQGLADSTAGCHIASSRATTFRSEDYLRDTYHYTQAGYNILGQDIAKFCVAYVTDRATTTQREVTISYRGTDNVGAFISASATGRAVFVPDGNYFLSSPVAGTFYSLGGAAVSDGTVQIIDLLSVRSETDDIHDVARSIDALSAEISADNLMLEDIYRQRVQDGTNTRMISVRLDPAVNAQYNQPGYFEGVYTRSNLTSPEDTPLHIDDEVLVGTPWGMSKERYLPKLRCVINAQKIYGSYNKENPAETGFGYWYSPSTEAKWQGNTTVATGKKSITIKLGDKVEIVPGWGKRKKYVIKNNIPNSPHSNLLLAKLWGDVVRADFNMRDDSITAKLKKLTNCGAIDGIPCTYTVNGQYYGLGSLNTPKDEHLFDIAGDDVAWVVGAGSNNRQLYVLLKNMAMDAFDNGRMDTLLDEVIGRYEDFSGLMGTLRRWCPSNQAVFPVFASHIKKALLAVHSATANGIQVADVETAIQSAIDGAVEHYKYLFNEGTERDSGSLSKSYMWSLYNARCQSAVWLRDLIMVNMVGISNGLAWAVKLYREGSRVEDEPFALNDPALFLNVMKNLDDGFEIEFTQDEVSPLPDINSVIDLLQQSPSLSLMQSVIDMGSVIDMMIFTLLSQDIDAINNNFLLATYGGKIFMSPYDMNQSFIIAGPAFAAPSSSLAVTLDTLRQSALYAYVLDNPDTKAALKARFTALRDGPLSDWAVAARMANITKYIAPQAYSAEETRWPMYGYFNEAWSANSVLDRYRMQAAIVTNVINNL